MTVEIKNISKSYGKKQVLRDINLNCSEGKAIAILGSNGCGKSTFFSILAGIQKGDSGEFLYDNKNLFKDKGDRTSLIGYVPQGTPLFDELTAYDNLLLWYDKKELESQLDRGMLKLLKIKEMLKIPVSKMSGGMKKRLSIACSISKKPRMLLLDEPMSALDLACKEEISAYLTDFKNHGGIILIATHDIMELELCDEYYIMKDGILEPFLWDGNLTNLVKCL